LFQKRSHGLAGFLKLILKLEPLNKPLINCSIGKDFVRIFTQR